MTSMIAKIAKIAMTAASYKASRPWWSVARRPELALGVTEATDLPAGWGARSDLMWAGRVRVAEGNRKLGAGMPQRRVDALRR